MIRYSLQCRHGHTFEEWFSNSADYDEKAAAGALTCPECGDTHVAKAIMAPNVGKGGTDAMPPCAMGGGCMGGCGFANS